MTDQQSITPEQAAEVLAALLPGLGRAETYPQWSDGAGEPVRRQRVTLYDAAGDVLSVGLGQHRAVLRLLLRVEGGDWDRPQTFTVDGATLALTYPVVPSLPVPLWDSPAAVSVPSVGALLEQRHQLEDDAEPPLAVAAPGADFARSLAVDVAAGLAESVEMWAARTGTNRTGTAPASVCEPEPAPAREVADVPVQDGAL